MKKFQWLTFSLGLLLILGACQDKDKSNDLLKNEVLAIHDEVMPKMSNLKEARKQILEKANTLEVQEADSLRVAEHKAVAMQLDDAYEGMFVWMRQYQPEPEKKSPEELETYLLDQKEKVTQVNIAIKRALNEAERLLEN
ncbi:hypothetical protein [Pararhodonellum marinum]|uniref:hypothetical protein n=1 Tax=Pararhodonellum marinum TaxID=2755358 RepID=UPI00188EB987|nr:hypothetical protein [Pararhodonellum marinum]